MTRKRVGQGLFEAFSEVCECCNGRGVHIRTEPVDATASAASGGSPAERKGRSRGGARKGAASSPAALEDPVEPAGARPQPTVDDTAAAAEPAPRRRRRRAEAPVTST
jgi:ribonuclease E